MKVEWTAEDIKPGRIVGRPDRRERWMIGYLTDYLNSDCRYALVSTSDGMVQARLTKEGMAQHLNAAEEIPVELLPTVLEQGTS